MPERLPVLIGCMHTDKNLARVKKRIDHYWGEGRKVLAIELHGKEKGLDSDVFFSYLKEYAEAKGMKVVPIDSQLGYERANRFREEIEIDRIISKREKLTEKQKQEKTKTYLSQLYKVFVIREKSTEIMVKKLKRVLQKHPDCLIMVGLAHTRGIRKAFPVKFERIGRTPIAGRLIHKYFLFHRKREKASRKLKNQRRRVK